MDAAIVKKTGLPFVLLVAGMTAAAPAQAQTVSLYCANPDLRYAYFVDVDYATSIVTVRIDIPANPPGQRFPARVTDSMITWQEPGTRHYSATQYTLNRITGQFSMCSSDDGCHLRTCKPAQRQF